MTNNLTGKDVSRLIQDYYHDPLGLLQELGGYYECPKDPTGKRLGPLVGYTSCDESGRQFVGDIYVNFAKAEDWPSVLYHWAVQLSLKLPAAIDVFCGAPEGGKAIAEMLAFVRDSHYIYPEKKVVELATPTSREKSALVFSRHQPQPGERVAIVEDVSNNFSTTQNLIALINGFQAETVAIISLLNRSLVVENEFSYQISGDCQVVIPVISLVCQKIAEYRQDDSEVAGDIQAGNIVLKPKDEWPRLKEAMAKISH